MLSNLVCHNLIMIIFNHQVISQRWEFWLWWTLFGYLSRHNIRSLLNTVCWDIQVYVPLCTGLEGHMQNLCKMSNLFLWPGVIGWFSNKNTSKQKHTWNGLIFFFCFNLLSLPHPQSHPNPTSELDHHCLFNKSVSSSLIIFAFGPSQHRKHRLRNYCIWCRLISILLAVNVQVQAGNCLTQEAFIPPKRKLLQNGTSIWLHQLHQREFWRILQAVKSAGKVP